MHDLEAHDQYVGAVLDALAKHGICAHTSVAGYIFPPVYPAQIGLTAGQCRCFDCGTLFESDEEWIAVSEALFTMTREQLNNQPRTHAWLALHKKEGNA